MALENPKSTLTLTVQKGPRQGESIECTSSKPNIRIGRVVRGNTFTIKDPAISQKHLSVELNAQGTGWVVIDLDTSNGTLLNGEPIDSLSPSELKDGDLIKIGEDSTLLVKITQVSAPAAAVETRPRRYATRRGATQTPCAEEDVAVEVPKVPRRRGRAKKAENLASEVESMQELPDIEKLQVKDSVDSSNGPSKLVDSGDVEKEARVVEENLNVDPEKMTLGEWFDSVEKYMPMVINDVAEEIIADLRERARLFHEFVSQKTSTCGPKN